MREGALTPNIRVLSKEFQDVGFQASEIDRRALIRYPDSWDKSSRILGFRVDYPKP